MMSKNNPLNFFKNKDNILKKYDIYAKLILIDIIEQTTSKYFNKDTTLIFDKYTNETYLIFNSNSKKVSVSYRLYKLLIENIKKFHYGEINALHLENNIKSSNKIKHKIKEYKFSNSNDYIGNNIIVAEVVKDMGRYYQAITENNLECIIKSSKEFKLDIGKKYFFNIYAIKKNKLFLKIDESVTQYVINYIINQIIKNKDLKIIVTKFIKNKILMFDYIFVRKKLPKDFFSELKRFFPYEKLIYKKIF